MGVQFRLVAVPHKVARGRGDFLGLWHNLGVILASPYFFSSPKSKGLGQVAPQRAKAKNLIAALSLYGIGWGWIDDV
jgi:hypothetical protein